MSFQKSSTAEIRMRLLVLEAQLSQVCSEMRYALNEAEEETRRSEAEVERFKLEFFTEEEAANLLKISSDTLARLRTKHKLPHLRPGTQIRYTNFHLVEIAELLERRPEGKKGKQNQLRSA